MTPTTIFMLIIVAAALIVAAGIVAVASRRKDSEGAVTQAELDRKAAKADRARRQAIEEVAASHGGGVTTTAVMVVEAPAEYRDDEPRREISEVEYGVTRRKFFNRAIGAVFGLFMLQFALAGLAFVWPKLKGGFGTPITVGPVAEIKAEVLREGKVVPKAVPAAQAWIIPFELSKLPGSSFEEIPFVIAGGESDGVGLMALWHRCVHLGCRVPECIPSQGFECPCHGSKFNRHGEYEGGPAPRNFDRFSVSVDSAGNFVIDTGTIVQTARSKKKTVAYPQGPFCVG
ncbi:MAG: Rieske 2Fe-2S domain-containing protein [Actinomycetota bacterium]|nr:Rieske 2Fe-2S domain-containing protein [Actinomycetota bacterium]